MAFKRGHPEAKSQIRKTTAILLTAIFTGELWDGFEIGNRRENNRDVLEGFLSSPRVSVAPIVTATAERLLEFMPTCANLTDLFQPMTCGSPRL